MKHYEYCEVLLVESWKRGLFGLKTHSHVVTNNGDDAQMIKDADYQEYLRTLNDMGNKGWEVIGVTKIMPTKNTVETRAFLKRDDEIYAVQEEEEIEEKWERRLSFLKN